MIQRIQTIWLLLASVTSFLTFKTSFYSGNIIINNQKQFMHLTATETIPLILVTGIIGVAAIILIFLFKDRKMQMRLTFVDLFVSLINIYLYINAMNKYAEGRIDWSCIFVLAVPVFLFLAFRGIYKDEKLVRSTDRLR